MAISYLEQQRQPIGNTFVYIVSDLEEDRSHAESALQRYPPSRLRRHHSLGSYVPHMLRTMELPKLETSKAALAASSPKREQGARSKAPRLPVGGSAGLGAENAAHDAENPGDTTTLMIRNLPKHVTQTALLEELDNSGFGGLYDFCYMPCSFETGESKGYAFVNFSSASSATAMASSWHRSHRLGLRAQEPALNISPAAEQGLERNLAKWRAPRMSRVRNPNLRPFVAERASNGSASTSAKSPRRKGRQQGQRTPQSRGTALPHDTPTPRATPTSQAAPRLPCWQEGHSLCRPTFPVACVLQPQALSTCIAPGSPAAFTTF